MPLSQSIATVQTNYEVSCKVLHSRKAVQFKALLDIHGEQFRTVSGSMRRLTLSLINLVKTLEITTKQLKNVILHILK